MRKNIVLPIILVLIAAVLGVISTGCGAYHFSDVGTIDDSVKTVKVSQFENLAAYVNPQLSPNLTDRLRQKIVNQTKLTQTNSDNAHYNITGAIKEYSVSTTGVTSTTGGQKQTSVNRLTVTVHVVLYKALKNVTEEFDVSRSFDFDANQSLQAAESVLLNEMVKNLTDEIFNHIFSNW